MATTFPNTRNDNQADRFGFTLFVAIAAHALVIFGIGFKLLEQRAAPASLEVTLALHKSSQPQEDAEFLAQVDQTGSGNQHDTTKITSPQISELPDVQTQTLQALPAQQQQTAASATLLSARTGNGRPDTPERQPSEVDQSGSNLPPAMQQQISSLKTQLDQQQQQYSRLPRTLRLTTASTKAAEQAAYLHYWINHVETVGNQNYPEEARRKQLYGDLRLAVTLLSDGTVEDVEILLSSGQRVLDQAAIRIVRMASPFSPLPPEMHSWDRLEIIRTWRFEKGNTLHTDS